MKKKLFISVLFFSVCTLAFTQSDLKVIAKIDYLRNEPITLGQLKKIVAPIEAVTGRQLTVDERAELLNALVGQRLLLQVAEKNRIKVLDSEVNAYFNNALSQQVGAPITEAQFATMVKQKYNQSLDAFMKSHTGKSVAENKKMIKEEMMIQKFVMKKKGKDIKKMSTPSDGDIRKKYELNKQSFFRPDMMKLFVVGVMKEGNNAAEIKKIENLRAKLKKSQKNIAMVQYDSAKGKYIAQYRYALKNAAGAQVLGLQIEALMQIFEKPVGFVSEIEDMPDNRQFFVITKKYPAKLLTLSDVIEPDQNVTVYETIKMGLTQQMQTLALQTANQALIKELRTDKNCKVLLSKSELKKLLAW